MSAVSIPDLFEPLAFSFFPSGSYLNGKGLIFSAYELICKMALNHDPC